MRSYGTTGQDLCPYGGPATARTVGTTPTVNSGVVARRRDMTDKDEAERARIGQEARDAVAGRRPRDGVLSALQKYLAAEQFRKKKKPPGRGGQ